MALGFGKSSSESSGTGRTQSKTLFPTEFLSEIHKTIGGPLTTKDLFTLSPQGHSLFGYGPTQGPQPGGGFSLGFGPPPDKLPGTEEPQAPGAGGQAPAPPVVGSATGQVGRRYNHRPDTPDELAADAAARAGGLGSLPPPSGGTPAAKPRMYTLGDIESQYVEDPDKVMDLPRLLDSAGLNPTGFSYNELENAIANAQKYGFSGRSRGNFARILGGLQRDTDLESTLGGTKGTGIF